MALIIEDGTIVANANSYVTLVEARAYAAARGVTLSAVDATLEVDAIKAMDYLEAQRAKYQGSKVDAAQSLQWPRYNVLIDDIEVEPDSIPLLLKYAQIRLMMELKAGVDLTPTRTGAIVKRDKTGPLETEYFEGTAVTEPEMSAVEALLKPLYDEDGGMFLTTVRV